MNDTVPLTTSKTKALPQPFGDLPAHRPMLVLAPMAGVTDLPCRLVARQWGADLTVSEMIASRAMVRHTPRSLRMAAMESLLAPQTVQIAGSEPEVMADAARMNVTLGADIIDINMGCPVRKVINSQSGAALLRDEALVERILTAVVAAVAPVPVTVKMRLGWDHDHQNGEAIARIAQQAGVAWIAVHGRTRNQMYQGLANWEAIGRIKDAVSIPVIGNGDVVTPRDARQRLAIAGVDGVMIGRAAMGRPWIFRQTAHFLQTGELLPDPTPEERYHLVLDHLDHILQHHGDHTGNLLARKHLAWYARGLHGASRFREAVNAAPVADATRRLAAQFFHPTAGATAGSEA